MGQLRKSKTVHLFYKKYSLKKESNNPNYVDKKLHRKIIVSFFKKLRNFLLEGGIYYPPHQMGEFKMYKGRPSEFNPLIDWHKTRKYFEETGERKFIFKYLNRYQTDGYFYYLKWFIKSYARMPLKRYVRFTGNLLYKYTSINGSNITVNCDNYLEEKDVATRWANKMLI